MNYNNYMDPHRNKNMSVPFGATIGTPASLSYPQQQAPGMHMPNVSYAQPSAPYQYNGQPQPGFCGNPHVQPAVYNQQMPLQMPQYQMPHQMLQHQSHYPQQVQTHTVGVMCPPTQLHHKNLHKHHGSHHKMHSNVYATHGSLTYKQQKKLDKKARKQQKKYMGLSSSSSSSSSDSD